MSVPHVVKEALEVIIDISRSAFPSTGDPKIDVPVEQIVEVLNVMPQEYISERTLKHSGYWIGDETVEVV